MAKRKSAKKIRLGSRAVAVIAAALIIALAAAALYGWFAWGKTPAETFGYIWSFIKGDGASDTGSNGSYTSQIFDDSTVQTVSDGDFSIHFLELGNRYTGDCIYIKAGDNDILIDAGSKTSSIPAIKSYLDTYVTDGVLEYVIATHAHEDHIAGFAGSESNPSLFRSYECEVIIDFPKTDSSSRIYARYVEERELEVEEGAQHYTALECYNNENGAQRTYALGEDTEMTFLYNYFYEHGAPSENDYSVCTLFTHNGKNYLFTGDLENEGSEKGEENLVKYNDLPVCELYKAGHHGSKTSSSSALLEVIRPKIICVCCCAGNDEYTDTAENQFPTQDFIDRVSAYTDAVYVTSLGDVNFLEGDDKDSRFGSFNGTIIALDDGGEDIKMFFSNNSLKLKETEWFSAMRRMPAAWAAG